MMGAILHLTVWAGLLALLCWILAFFMRGGSSTPTSSNDPKLRIKARHQKPMWQPGDDPKPKAPARPEAPPPDKEPMWK